MSTEQQIRNKEIESKMKDKPWHPRRRELRPIRFLRSHLSVVSRKVPENQSIVYQQQSQNAIKRTDETVSNLPTFRGLLKWSTTFSSYSLPITCWIWTADLVFGSVVAFRMKCLMNTADMVFVVRTQGRKMFFKCWLFDQACNWSLGWCFVARIKVITELWPSLIVCHQQLPIDQFDSSKILV